MMINLMTGDCRTYMRGVADVSVDAIICDPPYPEIDRDYGFWSEEEWRHLMQEVLLESHRILKPSGSAVFILQPNSARAGEMRLWLWEFVVMAGRTFADWGLIQDVYWWNYTALPGGVSTAGFLRPSVKHCVWVGPPHAYHNQSAVLWEESDDNRTTRQSERAMQRINARTTDRPSGHTVRNEQTRGRCVERGGVTPFNLLPIANGQTREGHGAATPYDLCEWWVKYITQPGDLVFDPFSGSGTVALACQTTGRHCIGIDRLEVNTQRARQRLGL